jgi:hypothetical protein
MILPATMYTRSPITPTRIPLLAFVLLLLVGPAAIAQIGTILGTVRNAQGEPLPGVTIQIEGRRQGAVTGKEGTFRIEQVPAGRIMLLARFVGHETARQTIQVGSGESARADFVLQEKDVSLREIEVRAARRQQEQSDTRTSVTKIEPREAKYLPGAAEDVMRSLRSLPGVLAPNDFSAQLVVRGSGPDQNLIVLDDIEVFNPYRLYGIVSMFNPETISDITLLTGGFPARYGDRLSAVLDVVNREGDRSEPVSGKLNASLTNANLILEGALPGGMRGGWLLSGRRTYYDLVAGPILRSFKLVDGDVALPNFRDLQFKAIISPSAEHSFVVNALTNRDGTELTSAADRDRIDSLTVVDRSYNSIAGLAWRYTPDGPFFSRTMVNWYENSGETEFGGEGGSRLLYGDISRDSLVRLIALLPPAFKDSLRRRGIDPDNPPAIGIDDGQASFGFRKYTLRNESVYDLPGHHLEAGAGIDLIRTALQFSARPDSLLQALRQGMGRMGYPDSVNTVADFYRTHAYLQDRIEIAEGFYLQPGLRFDYYGLIDRAYLSPRISLSWAVDPLTTLRAAYGSYYQSPGYEKLIDGQTFYDLTSEAVRSLRAERAIHYIVGASRMLTEDWQLKGEIYYKNFSDLIVQQRTTGTKYLSEPRGEGDIRYPSGWTAPVAVTSDSITTVPVNGATGEAYGIELLLQKSGSGEEGTLSGWAGYTLAWANRFRDDIRFPFNFDQRHTVNLVLNYRLNSWLELGSNFQLGSGYPYTPATGFSPVIVMAADSAGGRRPRIATNLFNEVIFQVDRGGIENVASARLPIYHRLDLRATAYTDWWNLDWSFYLDVINVYNHQNILSRGYYVERGRPELKTREVSMFPILPTLGMSVRF